MPHYLISVRIPGKIITGIRQHDNADLELMFRKYRMEADKHYHSILDFDCMMISKQSQVYKDYMRKKNPEKKVDLYCPPMFGSQNKFDYDKEWKKNHPNDDGSKTWKRKSENDL